MTTRRLPSLNALRAFEAASRHLSMRKAAEELHVTAAAVSQQVKSLEDSLGTKLLRRLHGKYILTKHGEAGLRDLRLGFEHLAAAATHMTRGKRDRLTVSVEPSFAATWLVPRLHRLKSRHPDLDVLLQATTELADLKVDPVDLAVRYRSNVGDDLAADHLFGEEVYPVCSPRLVQGRRALRKPGDLRHHTLLHLEWSLHQGEWPDWAAWLKAAGMEDTFTEKGLFFTEHAMALQAAVDGQGVALGSTALVADHLASGRLLRPFPLGVQTRFGYYAVCLPERASEPNISAFRRWLIDEAKSSNKVSGT